MLMSFFSKIPQAVGESVQKEKVTRSCFCFVFKAGKDFFEFLEDSFFFTGMITLLFFKLQTTLFFFEVNGQ